MFRKKNVSELKLELKQKKVKQLIESMLSTDSVEVYYAPVSFEYFLVDNFNKTYINISDSSVKISNHLYLYEVFLARSVLEDLCNKARDRVQSKVEIIKKSLVKNEMELIDKLKEQYEE